MHPLGDLTRNFDGVRRPVREADRRPGPYPYYGASGVVDHVEGYLFDGEYLLIAEDGENLRSRKTPIAFLARGQFWVNNHAHVVQGNDQADTRFLMYALQASDISGFLTGSTMPKLTKGNLNRIPILTPPVGEQLAIVTALGSLDEKIATNDRLVESLEAAARALFKSWFVDFEAHVPAGESGRPGAQDRAAEHPPGRMPPGWSVRRIAEVCKSIFSGGTPRTTQESYWGGGIPWLSSGETRSSFIIGTEKTITMEGVAGSSTRRARSGSTVIASAGQGHTRGQTSLLLLDSFVNQSVVALEADGVLLSDFYLYFDLERRYEHLRQISDSHSSRGSLTTKLVGDLHIVVPPRPLLDAFDVKVAPLVRRIEVALQESRALMATRELLMPKLLSGELRPGVADYELEVAGA